MEVSMILYMEYMSFCSSPALYFSNITKNAVSIIDSEFDKYDKQKVLKRLRFIKTFVENLGNLSKDNISKILIEGAKEKHDLFLLIYSKIAVFTDLIKLGAFNESSGLNLRTNQKIPFIESVSSNFRTVCDFSIGFLEGFNPELSDAEKSKLLDTVGLEMVKNNPDDFSTEFKDFLDKDSNPAENIYS